MLPFLNLDPANTTLGTVIILVYLIVIELVRTETNELKVKQAFYPVLIALTIAFAAILVTTVARSLK